MKHRAVLDASAAVHIVCGLPSAARLLGALGETALVLTPDLYFAEVANSLWKYVRHGAVEPEEAADWLDDATRLVDLRISTADLVDEALVAAIAHNHPVYDMLYAVLARRHGARVITMDQRLVSVLDKMEIEAVHGESHS